MTASPLLDRVVSRFADPVQNGTGVKVKCPSHEDRRPSLHLSIGKNGAVVLKCFAGCETGAILAAVGLTFADLFEPKAEPRREQPTYVAYGYHDEHGQLLYQAVRKQYRDHKDFFQRKPKPGGGWENNLAGVRRVLYRLPELLAADPLGYVLTVEGEGCVDRVVKEGGVATTNVGGAGKWRPEYSDDLRGRDVVLIPDCDLPGYKHMLDVCRSLDGKAASVSIVHLTEVGPKGDIVDALDAGLPWADLDALCTGERSHVFGAELIDIDQLVVLAGQEPPPEPSHPDPPPLAVTTSGDDTRHHASDLGNARRLVSRHGGDIRYCYPWAKWLVWDGRRWKLDDSGEIYRRAKETVAAIYREAAAADDATERKDLAKHALRSEAEARINAMVSLAESEPGIPVRPDDLDRNPWLLTVGNGTVNLQTGQLQAHDRTDLITKLAPVIYDELATCPTWDAFLDRVLASKSDLVDFVQRAIGYSLTGRTVERVAFILHGVGRNGKTTLLETMTATMGDYGDRTPTETLLAKRDTGIPNDVAALKSLRFAFASEAEEGRRLDEAKVKDLTGGDTISARFMRGEWFSFRPEFKLWLGTNHKPVIRGTDHAIWDRLRLIPFEVRIPEHEQDKNLRDKLLAEAPGILAWAVQGCLSWQRDGLGAPQDVTAATAAYRTEQDVLGSFIADACVEHADARVTAKDLHLAYQQWCDETGERPLTQKAVGQRLAERGFESARMGKARTRTWLGIGLRGDSDMPDDGAMADAFGEADASGRDIRHNSSFFSRETDMPENASARVRQQNASAYDGNHGEDQWTR